MKNKLLKYIRTTKLYIFIKQCFCTHMWKEHHVMYNFNKYPGTLYRVCKKCKKKQWSALFGKKWIQSIDIYKKH